MKWEWARPVTYSPVHPAAYVGRVSWASTLASLWLIGPVFALFGWIAIFDGGGWRLGAFLLLFLAFFLGSTWRSVSGQEVVIVVDSVGVFLGAASSGEGGQRPPLNTQPELIPWSRIESMVLFRRPFRMRRSSSYKSVVGLKLRGAPDGSPIVDLRIIQGWTFNRSALEDAVEYFGAGVPLVDAADRPR